MSQSQVLRERLHRHSDDVAEMWWGGFLGDQLRVATVHAADRQCSLELSKRIKGSIEGSMF